MFIDFEALRNDGVEITPAVDGVFIRFPRHDDDLLVEWLDQISKEFGTELAAQIHEQIVATIECSLLRKYVR